MENQDRNPQVEGSSTANEYAKATLTVSLGRQIGSGGRDIAKIVAARMGLRFFDREILNLAARESGFGEQFFADGDENKSFLKSLFHMHVPHLSDNNFYDNSFSQESLFKIQSDVMKQAAMEEPCLFVGRCSDYVLRNFPHLVSVFITADESDRIQRMMERHSCSEAQALRLIENGESDRSRYYNYYTGKHWGEAKSYDFCINSSLLGIEGTAEWIIETIKRMASFEC